MNKFRGEKIARSQLKSDQVNCHNSGKKNIMRLWQLVMIKVIAQFHSIELKMLKITSFGKIIAIAGVSMAIATLGSQIAQAKPTPRPKFLLDTPCVDTGVGRWREDDTNVSVGRAVYKSLLFMGPGNRFSALTCRIKPDQPKDTDVNFQSFYLEFGMRDNDRGSPANSVNIYLDDQPVISRSVIPGQRISITFDVRNVSNISIETVCSNQGQYCDRVYFFNATLDPSLPVSVENNKPTIPTINTPGTPNNIPDLSLPNLKNDNILPPPPVLPRPK